MQDSINIRGDFRMKVWKKINNSFILQEEYEDPNKIVTVGKTKLCKLLAGDGAANYVHKIGFGTGSTTPSISDTTLTSLYERNVLGFTYPTTTSINYTWELTTPENNGVTIAEYGLLSDDLTLFSRKIRSPIEKKIDILLTGDWTITFI